MHPVGLALTFLVFWSLVAVGAYLVLHSVRTLRGGTRSTSMIAVNAVTVLFGTVLVGIGFYALFIVLLAR